MVIRLKNHAKVSTQWFNITDLRPAPYNARTITQKALSGLTKSIESFGLLSLPVVNIRHKRPRIVGGHQRIATLKARGETRVLCITVDFDDQTEKRANFALNNPAIQGEFIPELTKQLLDQIRELDTEDAFKSLNFNELLRMTYKNLDPTPIVSFDTVSEAKREDIPAISKTKAVSAQQGAYTVGQSVVCASAVPVAGSLPVGKVDVSILELTAEQELTQGFVDARLDFAFKNTVGVVYAVTDTHNMAMVQDRYQAMGGHRSNTLIWVNEVTQPNGTPYRSAIIPVLYGWAKGSPHTFFGGRRESNVFTCRGVRNELPVDVMATLIRMSCDAGKWAYVPDLGSGSAVLAAHQLNRRVFGYAKSTRLCDVIRKRWAQFANVPGDWVTATPAFKRS